MAARQSEHLRVDVNAYYLSRSADYLGGDEADFAGATAEVQYRFSRIQIRRRVTTSVVTLDYVVRNHFQIARVITDRAAEGFLKLPSAVGIAFAHFLLDVKSGDHSICSPGST